jgi:hypothetical protein
MLGFAPAEALARHGPTMRARWAAIARDGIADDAREHVEIP